MGADVITEAVRGAYVSRVREQRAVRVKQVHRLQLELVAPASNQCSTWEPQNNYGRVAWLQLFNLRLDWLRCHMGRAANISMHWEKGSEITSLEHGPLLRQRGIELEHADDMLA